LSKVAPRYAIAQISEPLEHPSLRRERTMHKNSNVSVALAFACLGALALSASAQAPPRDHDGLSFWSSQAGELYEGDASTARPFDELTIRRANIPLIRDYVASSQQILICEPQGSFSTELYNTNAE
jgi:hypothetical protein